MSEKLYEKYVDSGADALSLAEVKDALAEFQQTTDPLTVWLERNTVEHPNAMVSQDELRRAYNGFCENTGKPGMTPQNFGRALSRVRPGVEKAQRTWGGVSNTRVYLGIGLRDSDPNHDPDRGAKATTNDNESAHDQRDQRNDPNCFGEQTPPELQINRETRVDRVESIASGDQRHFIP